MKTIQQRSVICIECNLPNSLDADNRCAFCRRVRVEESREQRNGNDVQILLTTLFLIGVGASAVWALWELAK